MSTTLVVVIGSNREKIVSRLHVMTGDQFHIVATNQDHDRNEILNLLIDYDRNEEYDDILFVTSDRESSEWFISNKYKEKVLLNEVTDTRLIRGPSITWYSVDELPSLLMTLRGIVSENANI